MFSFSIRVSRYSNQVLPIIRRCKCSDKRLGGFFLRGELFAAVEKLRDVRVTVDLRLEGSANMINIDRFLSGRDVMGGEALFIIRERLISSFRN